MTKRRERPLDDVEIVALARHAAEHEREELQRRVRAHHPTLWGDDD